MVSAMKVQIILAGIGGQGILFSSRIFSELGLRLGLEVMGSETHGMSQRGGSVIAHVKLGGFQSPMIRAGTADILYSFEENETYRTLKYLKRGGICFANLESLSRFDNQIKNYLKEKEIAFRAYDASGEASKIGSIMSANIVLLGYSVGTGLVPFKYEDLKHVLELMSRKKNLKINLKAFEIGFQEGKLAKE
ncbi:MAG: 2-oxoacid:acceptor oxidoreductase family protein, partial [Candidatus Aminicenantes bacterium]|nr:2-oxoacid:acceptor oxidoreductase family protein [Candidatus Aminicenantes bacterium]